MNIIQIFPGKVWGGAEQYILDLGTALEKQGNHIHYFAYNTPAITNRLQGKVKLTTLRFAGILDWSTINQLSKFIQEKQIDVIHIHDTRFVPMVVLAKRRSKQAVRIVLTRHIARASKVNWFYRSLFKSLHQIIFVSNLARKMWEEANTWMPKEKMTVIHNSIPETYDEQEGDSLRQRFNIAQETPLIVFTGRVRRSKGCAVLVEALAAIKHLPYHMVFIGTCKPKDYNNQLINHAKRLGIAERISFYGFSNQTRLLIKEATIGVAPSIVREACPLSPMEFMQASKCIIATNNGAQPEYITSRETGVLVSPKSVEELSSALEELIQNPSLCSRIGEQAKEYFNKHMSYAMFIHKITSCYTLAAEE